MNTGRRHRGIKASRHQGDRKRCAGRGFTLIEVIVIVLILGVLAAVIAPRLISRVGQSKTKVAETNAAVLVSAVRMYMADHGTPAEGATIDILWERPGEVEESAWEPYVETEAALTDPWGRKFILQVPSERPQVEFDVISYGADGKPGGDGENADIIKP